MNQVVVGIAGHIDHGKTALVKALTGINTDNLNEEIRRGMTIDIGFAFLSEEITLIDVPGHEKFVKNMMAGVSGIDAAVLVIAADDGVMPQSREHLDILNILGVQTGCVVINKVDLVDQEWLELVESDLQDLLAGTFLEKAPILLTSATRGEGIESLKDEIIHLCKSIPEKQDNGVFRLNIDRVFTMKGFGTVSTGTVSSGSLRLGQTIELLPKGKMLKVRGLQSHSQKVDNVTFRDRAAINLANIEKMNIKRGDILAEPDYFLSTSQVGVQVNVLATSAKPILQNQRVRIHAGTQEVMGRIAIIQAKTIQPGESQPALIRLEKYSVMPYGEKFIIRSYSPVVTIGGGKVLTSIVTDKWKIASQKIYSLFLAEEKDRMKIELESHGFRPLSEAEVKYTFSISLDFIEKIVEDDPHLTWASYKTDRWLVTLTQLDQFEESILEYLKIFHQKFTYRLGPQKEEIRQAIKANIRFLEFVINKLFEKRRLSQNGEIIHLPDHKIQLNTDERQLMDKLTTFLNSEKFSSSSISELSRITGESEKKVKLLLDIAEQQGLIIRLMGKLLFTQENFILLKTKILEFFQNHDILTVTDFKNLAGTSRKYAMPLLEYFDKLKITSRVEGGRILYD